jgi:cytochrome c-type biogenesis protein CcmE
VIRDTAHGIPTDDELRMSKGVQIAVAVATALGGLVALLMLGAPDDGTFSYYKDVDSYLAAQPGPGARGQRVHGFVVAGSIAKDLTAGHVDFRIADRESVRQLAVRYHGIDVPDLFRDGAEVVVEGRASDGGFAAQRVLAKCPSKYEVKPGSEA